VPGFKFFPQVIMWKGTNVRSLLIAFLKLGPLGPMSECSKRSRYKLQYHELCQLNNKASSLPWTFKTVCKNVDCSQVAHTGSVLLFSVDMNWEFLSPMQLHDYQFPNQTLLYGTGLGSLGKSKHANLDHTATVLNPMCTLKNVCSQIQNWRLVHHTCTRET
jgi:hypothetical protein